MSITGWLLIIMGHRLQMGHGGWLEQSGLCVPLKNITAGEQILFCSEHSTMDNSRANFYRISSLTNDIPVVSSFPVCGLSW